MAVIHLNRAASHHSTILRAQHHIHELRKEIATLAGHNSEGNATDIETAYGVPATANTVYETAVANISTALNGDAFNAFLNQIA